MKSLAMLNLKSHKSSDPDFCSLIKAELTIINKNVLYITYMQDKILKILKKYDADNALQTQVDEYFDEKGEAKM